MAEDIEESYKSSLQDLTFNSKPLINMLTMLAEDSEQYATEIVQVIEQHIDQVKPSHKLPVMYLIDSIVKNLPSTLYPTLLSQNIVTIFSGVFQEVDEKTRQSLFKLRQTWKDIFPNKRLYGIDVRVNMLDPAWPITAQPPEQGNIHVNPKFLVQSAEEKAARFSPPAPSPPPDDAEELMRQQLQAKEQELQKLKLELELAETRAKLEQQKKQLEEKHRAEQERLKSVQTVPETEPQTKAGSSGPRDPRLASRDPRKSTRDPRLPQSQPMASPSGNLAVLENTNVVAALSNVLLGGQSAGDSTGSDSDSVVTLKVPTTPKKEKQEKLKEEKKPSPPSKKSSPDKKGKPEQTDRKPDRKDKSATEKKSPKKDIVRNTKEKQKDSSREIKKKSSKSDLREISKNHDTKDSRQSRSISPRDRKDRKDSKEKDTKLKMRDKNEKRSSDEEYAKFKKQSRREDEVNEDNFWRLNRGARTFRPRNGDRSEPRGRRGSKDEYERSPRRSRSPQRREKERIQSNPKPVPKIELKKEPQEHHMRTLPDLPLPTAMPLDQILPKDFDVQPPKKLSTLNVKREASEMDIDERSMDGRPVGPPDKKRLRTEAAAGNSGNLFGGEDMDYRYGGGTPLKSPMHDGWMKFKTSRPDEYAEELERRKSRDETPLEDIDFRRIQSPPLKMRPPPFPPLQLTTNISIPQELGLERQKEILLQAERQLQAGTLSHEQHQELLKQLGAVFDMQRQRQKQSTRVDPRVAAREAREKEAMDMTIKQEDVDHRKVPGGPEKHPMDVDRRQGLPDFDIRKRQPQSDIDIRKKLLADLDIRRKRLTDTDSRKPLPTDTDIRQQAPTDVDIRQKQTRRDPRKRLPLEVEKKQPEVDQVPLNIDTLKQPSVDVDIRQKPPTDVDIRQPPPSDVDIRQKPAHSDDKQKPADFDSRKKPAGVDMKAVDTDIRQRPDGDIRNQHILDVKTKVPTDVDIRQQTPRDVDVRQQAQADVDVRQLPKADVDSRKIQGADIDVRNRPSVEKDARQIPLLTSPKRTDGESLKDIDVRQQSPSDVDRRPKPSIDVDSRQKPPSDVDSRPKPPGDVDSRPKPPGDVDSRPKPPNDVDSRQKAVNDVDIRQKPLDDVDHKQTQNNNDSKEGAIVQQTPIITDEIKTSGIENKEEILKDVDLQKHSNEDVIDHKKPVDSVETSQKSREDVDIRKDPPMDLDMRKQSPLETPKRANQPMNIGDHNLPLLDDHRQDVHPMDVDVRPMRQSPPHLAREDSDLRLGLPHGDFGDHDLRQRPPQDYNQRGMPQDVDHRGNNRPFDSRGPPQDSDPRGPPGDFGPRGPPRDFDPRGPREFGPRGPGDFDQRGPPGDFDPRGPGDFDQRGPPGDFDPRGPPRDFDPRGPPRDFDPRGPPRDFDPRGPPRDRPRDFDPRDRPQDFDPRDRPQDFDPRDRPQDFDPRDRTQEFDPRGPQRDFDSRGPQDYDPRGPPRPHPRDARNYDPRGPSAEYDPSEPQMNYDRRGPRPDFDHHGPPHEFNRRGHSEEFDQRGPSRDFDYRGPPRSHDRPDPRQDMPPPRDFEPHSRDRPRHHDLDHRGPRPDFDHRGPRKRPDFEDRDRFGGRRNQGDRPGRYQRRDERDDRFRDGPRDDKYPDRRDRLNKGPHDGRRHDDYEDSRWKAMQGFQQVEAREEFVIDGRAYEMKVGSRPKKIKVKGIFLEVFADPAQRGIVINGKLLYKFGEPIKRVEFERRTYTLYFHGLRKAVWIDGTQHELRIDAPPRNIVVDGKPRGFQIDGRDMMILVDRIEKGTYGGPPRQLLIENVIHEIRFDAPPRQILIDGQSCDLILDRAVPVVIYNGKPHGIRFDGPPREMIIDDYKFVVPMDDAAKVRIKHKPHFLAFGGPAHEVIIDGKRYEIKFDNVPREIVIGHNQHTIRLEGPTPNVKILNEVPIEYENFMFKSFGMQVQPAVSQQPVNMAVPGPVSPAGPVALGPRPMMQPQPVMQQPGMGQPMQAMQGGMMMQGGPVMMQNQMMGGMQPMMGGLPMQQGQIMMGGMQQGQMFMQPAVPVSQGVGLPNVLSSLLPGAGLQTTAAPSPAMDVSSLFQKLVAAGIIPKGEKTDKPKEAEPEKKEVLRPREDRRNRREDRRNDRRDDRRDDRSKKTFGAGKDKYTKVPEFTLGKTDQFKEFYRGVIQGIYEGIQCSSCGTRFRMEDTNIYREHLDWHFRQNKRGKDDTKVARNRNWYYKITDWIQFEEFGDLEERGHSQIFDKMLQGQGQSTTDTPGPTLAAPLAGNTGVSCPAATGNEQDDMCCICHDPFEQYWNEEAEDWHLRDALRIDKKTYHPVCYEDAREEGTILEPSPTPTTSTSVNPLVEQIQQTTLKTEPSTSLPTLTEPEPVAVSMPVSEQTSTVVAVKSEPVSVEETVTPSVEASSPPIKQEPVEKPESSSDTGTDTVKEDKS